MSVMAKIARGDVSGSRVRISRPWIAWARVAIERARAWDLQR
jgi:hypothetical protein